MEEETRRQIRMKELELSQTSLDVSQTRSAEFDINKYKRLVPPFNEKDVDKYFTLFENVAVTLKWPKQVWPLLLQSIFIGKEQSAYASLSEDSLDYEEVKNAVLRAYELVPEAYRQKFRRFQKSDSLTYVEFGREKEALFDREFKPFKLPEMITTHISKQRVSTMSEAAVLADEYVLTHKDTLGKQHLPPERNP